MNNNKTKLIIGIALVVLGISWTLSSFGIQIITFPGFIKAISLTWPLLFVLIGMKMAWPEKHNILAAAYAIFIIIVFATAILESGFLFNNIMNFQPNNVPNIKRPW